MICKFCDRVFEFDRSKGHRKNCCNGCNTKIRRVRNKLKAIKYLGGKCSRCGFNDHPSALEFHHKTEEKNINIGMVANKSWKNIIKPELEHCELLCSNCHRIEHSNRFDKDFIELLKKEKRI